MIYDFSQQNRHGARTVVCWWYCACVAEVDRGAEAENFKFYQVNLIKAVR